MTLLHRTELSKCLSFIFIYFYFFPINTKTLFGRHGRLVDVKQTSKQRCVLTTILPTQDIVLTSI